MRFGNLINILACFSLLFLFIQAPLLAQKSKEQLEKERKENLRKILETEKILQETEVEKKATIGQLTALNRQIQARESLISSMRQEINMLDGEITDLTIVVSSLQEDLKNLKEEYAAMIFSAYKSSWGLQRLTFLFSAKTFNQLVRRMAYLEQYTEARQIQVEQIIVVTNALAEQRNSVQSKKEEQSKLLTEQIRQNQNLLGLKNKQAELVASLSDKEKELKVAMEAQRKSVAQLDKLIADLIAKEIKEKEATTSTSVVATESKKLTTSFESSQKKLSWPVETGFISSRFGEQPHPVLKGIMVNNQGVDIQTNSNSPVKAVFSGKVATIAFVPGMNNVVILQHGDYYTVYSKLKKVNVTKGDLVDINDIIGEVYTDQQGLSELQFQVWKSSTKLDPEKWLSVR